MHQGLKEPKKNVDSWFELVHAGKENGYVINAGLPDLNKPIDAVGYNYHYT